MCESDFSFFEKFNRKRMREKFKDFKREIEVDESYFGARRVRGKKGRGAYKKPSFLAF